MISEDPNAITPGTEAYKRMGDYRLALGELEILAVSGRNSLRRLFSLWILWRQGARLLRESGFDAITAQAPDESGLVGYWLSRHFSVPLQIQIHTDVFSSYYRRASWKERLRWYLARFLIPRADCIRVVSQRMAKCLCQTKFGTRAKLSLAQKITILPIFTDISKYTALRANPEMERRFRDYDFKMLAVGRFLDKEKNFSMLIEMMRDFVKMHRSSVLVLVGEGGERTNYELRITNYGLGKNVIIEPWRDDLPSFYKCFDVFLLSSNYEGWGRAVIEAMASGLAVVMTDVGLAGEIVKNGKNGIVVPVGDKKAFLAAVADLYNNPGKRRELAAAGQETARCLPPKTKEEYLKLYKQSFLSCLL